VVGSIVRIFESALSIWDHKNKTKYLKKMRKLKAKYDKEKDENPVDHNTLDRIERDIVRLSDLAAIEIGRSSAVSLQE
jgi:hypothetical protein